MVRVMVNKDGQVEEADLERTSGYEMLDRAAVEAVEKWRFAPGTINGEAAAMWVSIPVRFALK